MVASIHHVWVALGKHDARGACRVAFLLEPLTSQLSTPEPVRNRQLGSDADDLDVHLPQPESHSDTGRATESPECR